jgi:hypothetical protein
VEGDFSAFLQDYGIERVILEKHTGRSLSFCDALAVNPPPQLVLEREIPIDTNQRYLEGSIGIYRSPKVTRQTKNELALPSTVVKGGMRIDLPR